MGFTCIHGVLRMKTAKDFEKTIRRHIESLGEIISYLKSKDEEFIVRKLQSVQGFLAYLEKALKEVKSDTPKD